MLLFFAAAVWWGWSLLRQDDGTIGWSWWVLLAGYLALICLWGAIYPFTPEFVKREMRRADGSGTYDREEA